MSRKDCDPGARLGASGAGDDIAERRSGANTTSGCRPPAVNDLADIRFHRAVARLHSLGPRATAELLAEIGARYMIRYPIEATVAAYVERLDLVTLAAVGADRFAPTPVVHVIRGGR
jgi:hypothetical protein